MLRFVGESVNYSENKVPQSSHYSSYWPYEQQNKQSERQNGNMFKVVLRRSLVGLELHPLLIIKFLAVDTTSMVRVATFGSCLLKVGLVLFIELFHKLLTEVSSAVLSCCAVHKHVMNKV